MTISTEDALLSMVFWGIFWLILIVISIWSWNYLTEILSVYHTRDIIVDVAMPVILLQILIWMIKK